MTSRIPADPGLRDLGVANWLVCKAVAARQRVPAAHLFTTLGQHKRLAWAWLPFAGVLMRGGKLSTRDTELVILRVGHLRESQYELQHHRRMGRAAGLDDATQHIIFDGPAGANFDQLNPRQQVLVAAVDELVETRSLSDSTWAQLCAHLDRPRLIEFVMLTCQYDALAATLSALRVPLDYQQ